MAGWSRRIHIAGFDAEAFLHALDLAFEDSYFNDDADGSTSRLVIIKTLLEILASSSSSDLPPTARTFVHIFVARNVPKYPQSVQLAPSVLHGILVGLTTDADWSTREDRQLAAEYLLSAYTPPPHETERLLQSFEDAGFYRILRTWHRQEKRWEALFLAHLHDPDIRSPELFAHADEIFITAARLQHDGAVPDDLRDTVAASLPDLLNAGVIDTARFLDRHAPQLHERAIDSIGPDDDLRRFAYLRCLLGPPSADEEQAPRSGPSAEVSPRLRQMYVALLCKVDPAGVIPSLRYLPPDDDFLKWDEALRTCEDEGVLDAVVWALDWRGDPKAALDKVRTFGTRLSATIGELVARDAAEGSERQLRQQVESLEAIGRTGVAICVERSSSSKDKQAASEDVSVEDLWFQLLRTQICTVQAVSACCVSSNADADAGREEAPPAERALTTLRSLVQATFSSLVSASGARGRGRGISFPRLFTRLVETTATNHESAGGTPYTEFRTILTGMMEAYRAEGDMLVITKHLLDRDVFETVEMAARARSRGWAMRDAAGTCAGCRLSLVPLKQQVGVGGNGAAGVGASLGRDRCSKGKGKGAVREIVGVGVEYGEDEDEDERRKITIMRTGIAYHRSCVPP